MVVLVGLVGGIVPLATSPAQAENAFRWRNLGVDPLFPQVEDPLEFSRFVLTDKARKALGFLGLTPAAIRDFQFRVQRGQYERVPIPNGTNFEAMAFGTPVRIVRNVIWSGGRTIEGWRIRATDGVTEFVIDTPFKCGNLALRAVRPIAAKPVPPPVARPTPAAPQVNVTVNVTVQQQQQQVVVAPTPTPAPEAIPVPTPAPTPAKKCVCFYKYYVGQRGSAGGVTMMVDGLSTVTIAGQAAWVQGCFEPGQTLTISEIVTDGSRPAQVGIYARRGPDLWVRVGLLGPGQVSQDPQNRNRWFFSWRFEGETLTVYWENWFGSGILREMPATLTR
jgi:hypothetical protein